MKRTFWCRDISDFLTCRLEEARDRRTDSDLLVVHLADAPEDTSERILHRDEVSAAMDAIRRKDVPAIVALLNGEPAIDMAEAA